LPFLNGNVKVSKALIFKWEVYCRAVAGNQYRSRAGGTEALCDLLNSLEVSGLVIEDGSDLEDFIENYKQYWDYIDEDFINKRRSQHLVKFYLSDDEDGRNTLNALRPRLESAGYTLSVTSMRDEDWENNWKRYYITDKVGKKAAHSPRMGGNSRK
jgi:ribosomal protein L11 methyltransferase